MQPLTRLKLCLWTLLRSIVQFSALRWRYFHLHPLCCAQWFDSVPCSKNIPFSFCLSGKIFSLVPSLLRSMVQFSALQWSYINYLVLFNVDTLHVPSLLCLTVQFRAVQWNYISYLNPLSCWLLCHVRGRINR